MAQISEPMQKDWDDWCKSRGPKVVEAGKKLVPWKLYRDKETGLRCTIRGFTEEQANPDAPVTVIADFTGKFNLINFGRRVHGMALDQLEECDLPAPGEPIGILWDDDERLEYINARRKENGLHPLTHEQLKEFSTDKNEEAVTCAIDGTPLKGANDGKGEGQEEGRQEESGKGEGQDQASQAGTQAVPAQEAGPADDQGTDKT